MPDVKHPFAARNKAQRICKGDCLSAERTLLNLLYLPVIME